MRSNKRPTKDRRPAFTIVELLVVIVVIGILAAITVVSYSGITSRATVASVQSDLDNASRLLKMYGVEYGSYPTALDGSNCPTAPTVDSKYCLKASTGTTLAYSSVAPSTFHLTATKNATAYAVTNGSSPAIATTANGSSTGSACPSGFIPVPGSGTYGTNDFCVMKYEAKDAGSNVPVSQPTGSPWVSISQTTAITNSANVAGCTGCHLITEAEWMTIAQNVLSVAFNWSTGTVGSGFIYRGHNDNVPANALAVSNTGDGYSDTGNVSNSDQKRTLTLTNGEVIWDMAGNVWEWTSGTVTTGQPGITGEGTYAWKEWTAVTAPGSLTVPATPASTGITGASSWNTGNGVGGLYSYAGETAARGFLRGGYWYDGSGVGVLYLALNFAPGNTSASVGFRVSR